MIPLAAAALLAALARLINLRSPPRLISEIVILVHRLAPGAAKILLAMALVPLKAKAAAMNAEGNVRILNVPTKPGS